MKKSKFKIVGLLMFISMVIFKVQLVFADAILPTTTNPTPKPTSNPTQNLALIILIAVAVIGISLASIFVIRYIVKKAKASPDVKKTDDI